MSELDMFQTGFIVLMGLWLAIRASVNDHKFQQLAKKIAYLEGYAGPPTPEDE